MINPRYKTHLSHPLCPHRMDTYFAYRNLVALDWTAQEGKREGVRMDVYVFDKLLESF